MIDINLNGVLYGMRYQIPAMLKTNARECSIVNMASIHGTVAAIGNGAYTAAKHGVVGLTKNAAAEPPTYVLPRALFPSPSVHGNGGEDSLELIGDASLPATYLPDASIAGTGTLSAANVALGFASIESITANAFSSLTAITPNANDMLTLSGSTLSGSRATTRAGTVI